MKIKAAVWISLLTPAIMVAQQTQPAPGGDLDVIHVQGNVWMIAGAGGNVAVQIGDMGVVVVDPGLPQYTAQLLAAIRKLSDKPIQYIIDTSMHADHTGANDEIRRAGVTITGANVAGDLRDAGVGAQIVAHQNVMDRMSADVPGGGTAAPRGAWPEDTYVSGQKELFFNGESIVAIYQPNASTDGDSLVYFRRSDVLIAGDIFSTLSYPFIDVANGGTIQGEINALNNILDIAIPGHEEEGGTYIIPGHGRICDEYDLLEYRDMVTIVRDRVQAAIKKGLTLEQIGKAGFTKDYDARYNTKNTPVPADRFIEAIYTSLTSKGNQGTSARLSEAAPHR